MAFPDSPCAQDQPSGVAQCRGKGTGQSRETWILAAALPVTLMPVNRLHSLDLSVLHFKLGWVKGAGSFYFLY